MKTGIKISNTALTTSVINYYWIITNNNNYYKSIAPPVDGPGPGNPIEPFFIRLQTDNLTNQILVLLNLSEQVIFLSLRFFDHKNL